MCDFVEDYSFGGNIFDRIGYIVCQIIFVHQKQQCLAVVQWSLAALRCDSQLSGCCLIMKTISAYCRETQVLVIDLQIDYGLHCRKPSTYLCIYNIYLFPVIHLRPFCSNILLLTALRMIFLAQIHVDRG